MNAEYLKCIRNLKVGDQVEYYCRSGMSSGYPITLGYSHKPTGYTNIADVVLVLKDVKVRQMYGQSVNLIGLGSKYLNSQFHSVHPYSQCNSHIRKFMSTHPAIVVQYPGGFKVLNEEILIAKIHKPHDGLFPLTAGEDLL